MADDKLGVDQTVAFFEELANVVVEAMDYKNWMDLLALLPKVKHVLETGKNALPELDSLTKEEAFKITEAAYAAFKKIMEAVKPEEKV